MPSPAYAAGEVYSKKKKKRITKNVFFGGIKQL